MTKAEAAELKRRFADSVNPTRYVIASPIIKPHAFFYSPSHGAYLMDEITESVMFKRKSEALAVARLVEGGRRSKKVPKDIQVIAVRKTKHGVRILDELRDPWNRRRKWKPVLRRVGRKNA